VAALLILLLSMANHHQPVAAFNSFGYYPDPREIPGVLLGLPENYTVPGSGISCDGVLVESNFLSQKRAISRIKFLLFGSRGPFGGGLLQTLNPKR
jgi:hypothetical protein